MEVDIDVGSSSVAATVVNLVQGATKSLVVDMGIVLEGHSAEELPESLLGTVSHLHRSFPHSFSYASPERLPGSLPKCTAWQVIIGLSVGRLC